MNWKRNFNLLNAGFIAAFLILLTLSLLSYHLFTEQIEDQHLVDQTNEVLLTSKDLLSNLKDAETGQRGYLITGNEEFLEPFYRSLERNTFLMHKLKRLTADYPAQQKRCLRAEELIAQKMWYTRSSIRHKRNKDEDEVLRMINSGKGRELMDKIRIVFGEIDREEQWLLKVRTNETKTIQDAMKPVLITGIALSMVLLLVIYVFLQRQIAARTKKETELLESRNWLSVTLSSIGDGVIATDEHFLVTFMNPVAEDLTGWHEADAKGKSIETIFNIVSEKTRHKVDNPLITAITGNKIALLPENTLLIRKDKTELCIDDSGSPIADSEGRIIGGILIFRDISARKNAEQELNMFFDISMDLVGLATPEGFFTRINPSVTRTLGYSEKEFTARTFLDFVHVDDLQNTFEALSQLATGVPVINFTNRYLCKNGMYKWLEWNVSPRGGVFYAIARDITQRKEAEQLLTGLHHDLKNKNQEIVDSITYAKRIQTAFLPDMTALNDIMPDSFLFYKPKDIVSGDFYWTHKTKNKVFLAVADCTGHGVPGALLSIIGSQKLDEAILRYNDVSGILNFMNNEIKSSLKQLNDKHSSRDGMDIVLCCLEFGDAENPTVNFTYAGANRPVWIIRQGSDEVDQLKGTKLALGGLTDLGQEFESESLNLQRGDAIYLFTDGYADQFGGDRGKKLMTKRFREIVLGISKKPMRDQGYYLETFIEEWKDGAEQIDDILVVGVRV